ncbi:MAG: glycine--tRNA ligase subunit beta [Rhodobiaceae bacterium]|jgi:glycyl-tRNA synthetase beta chain|nr:glycine--tRNA ligase subunit beta [Rhodobiaceae bacterium]MBT7279741.1 glycine--tRNA ligase subunit beta [Rhodobiaceae bacterium]
MTDFVLELYSEEIPAGLQAGAAAQLERHITGFLKSFDVVPAQVNAYAAPQRLALCVEGLPLTLPDRKEEKKGPRVDAPEKAIDGFLRANQLDNVAALSVREDKKGAFYVLEIDEPGRPLAEALSDFLPEMISGFQWLKSMRWGDGSLRWVRPLRAILCMLDGQIVPFEVEGLRSGETSFGHRFMAPAALPIAHAKDYLGTLEKAFVLADAPVREAMVMEGASALAKSVGCTLVEDSGLMRETAGLVEWPVPLLGAIDAAFMDVPEEVLVSVMRTHQKYFALRTADGKLAPYFITISNIETPDKGAAIVNGNQRVLRARLSDGRFFWDQDRKETLHSRLPALEKVTFQAKLGTVREKAERISKLAETLAPVLGADAALSAQAGQLAKADLTSGMVYEFPELQGIMGGYYAAHDGLGDAVAAAIRSHYAPQGPDDAIPDSAEGRAVALADKLDTLAGFWSIDEKPTGSKDPYALRRAALGVIRILLETETRLALRPVLETAFSLYGVTKAQTYVGDLLSFIADRLKAHLRDQNVRHDVVSAIFALGSDDVFEMVQRAQSLQAFLAQEDGANLQAAFNRANGICQKADHSAMEVEESLLVDPAERALFEAMAGLADIDIGGLAGYDAYLDALATLRAPVDAFFEAVMVNDDDAKIRHNRLSLLQALAHGMRRAAAFDEIE